MYGACSPTLCFRPRVTRAILAAAALLLVGLPLRAEPPAGAGASQQPTQGEQSAATSPHRRPWVEAGLGAGLVVPNPGDPDASMRPGLGYRALGFGRVMPAAALGVLYETASFSWDRAGYEDQKLRASYQMVAGAIRIYLLEQGWADPYFHLGFGWLGQDGSGHRSGCSYGNSTAFQFAAGLDVYALWWLRLGGSVASTSGGAVHCVLAAGSGPEPVSFSPGFAAVFGATVGY
jgi:hypothetical protein